MNIHKDVPHLGWVIRELFKHACLGHNLGLCQNSVLDRFALSSAYYYISHASLNAMVSPYDVTFSSFMNMVV